MSAVPTLEVAWGWSWVPRRHAPADDAARWDAETAALFAQWSAAGVEGLLAGAPPEVRDELTADAVGAEVARWLRERAAGAPDWAQVAWGAVFVTDDRPLYAPVVATVEVRTPQGDDTTYLMDAVGSGGLPDDARPPTVEYVSTDAGDGVRVSALVRGQHGQVFLRVDAALRLEPPAGDPVDVLVSTRVSDLPLFGLVGLGVDELLQVIAADAVEPGAGARRGADEQGTAEDVRSAP